MLDLSSRLQELAKDEALTVEEVNQLRDEIKAEFDAPYETFWFRNFVAFYNTLNGDQRAKVSERLEKMSDRPGTPDRKTGRAQSKSKRVSATPSIGSQEYGSRRQVPLAGFCLPAVRIDCLRVIVNRLVGLNFDRAMVALRTWRSSLLPARTHGLMKKR